MQSLLADHSRPAAMAGLAASLTGLLGLWVPPEALPHIAAILAAVAALAGQYVPRRSLARKLELAAVNRDPVSRAKARRRKK